MVYLCGGFSLIKIAPKDQKDRLYGIKRKRERRTESKSPQASCAEAQRIPRTVEKIADFEYFPFRCRSAKELAHAFSPLSLSPDSLALEEAAKEEEEENGRSSTPSGTDLRIR